MQSPIAWGFALALVGYPVVGQVAGLVGVVDETYSNAFRVGTVLVCAVAFWAARRWLVSLDIWWLLFLGLYALRLALDWSAGVPQVEAAALYLLVLSILPALLLTAGMRGWRTTDAILAVLVVSAIATVLAVVVPSVSGEEDYFATGRLQFEKVNAITLGHAAVTLLIAVAAGWGLFRGVWARLLMLGLVAAACVCIYQASSRGALVAAAGCLAIYIIFRIRHWWLTVPAICGWALLFFEPSEEVSRLMEMLRLSTVGSDLSSIERIYSYSYAWEAFVANPLFGEAFVMGDGWYPHNLFLETAMAMGLPGLVVLAVVVVKASFIGVRMVAGGNLLLPMLFFQALIGAQFSGALWGNASFWITASVLLVYGRLSQEDRRRQAHPSRLDRAYGPRSA